MNNFSSALWAEILKMRRSKVPLFTSIGFFILPLVGGLFMIILKDPEAAKSMGLISTKAQITMGTADWSAFFNLLSQGTAIGGMILFSIIQIAANSWRALQWWSYVRWRIVWLYCWAARLLSPGCG